MESNRKRRVNKQLHNTLLMKAGEREDEAEVVNRRERQERATKMTGGIAVYFLAAVFLGAAAFFVVALAAAALARYGISTPTRQE